MGSYLRIDRVEGRTIVVGDVHGCWAELNELLRVVDLGPSDLLVSVGDVLDRGPRSWDCARFFRDTPNAVCALGNHERRVAGTVRGTSRPAWTQLQTLSRLPRHEWAPWADWLLQLPAVIETPHAVVSHARLDPARPLDDQNPYHTCAVGGGSVVIQKDRDGVPLWFWKLAAAKPVCIGHVGYERVELVPGKLFALDTGAVAKGKLTAVVFPTARLVAVPVTRDYFAEAKVSWQAEQLAQKTDLATLTLAEASRAMGARPGSATEALGRRVASHLQHLLPAERRQGVVAALRGRFGALPDSRLGRRDYLRSVQAAFAAPACGALATQLLLGLDASGVLGLPGRLTLADFAATLVSLERDLGLPAVSGEPDPGS